MPMTRSLAAKIVSAVSADPDCVERISSVFSKIPAESRLAGQLRNLCWAGWASLAGISTKYICLGIAEASSNAISRANLPGVTFASAEPDDPENNKHWGTLVTVQTKRLSYYVFDWWMSLDVNNPILFHRSDWKTGLYARGTPFSKFQGFSVDPAGPNEPAKPKK